MEEVWRLLLLLLIAYVVVIAHVLLMVVVVVRGVPSVGTASLVRIGGLLVRWRGRACGARRSASPAKADADGNARSSTGGAAVSGAARLGTSGATGLSKSGAATH